MEKRTGPAGSPVANPWKSHYHLNKEQGRWFGIGLPQGRIVMWNMPTGSSKDNILMSRVKHIPHGYL